MRASEATRRCHVGVFPAAPAGRGRETITPTVDPRAGATGATTGGACPDGTRRVADGVVDGRPAGARP